jgi:hypothetical protein
MLRIPHCLDNRLTDGGEFVSTKHRLRSTPQKHYSSVSGTYFCYRLSKSQGIVLSEGLGKLKQLIHLIGSRTRDFLVYSSVSTTKLPRVLSLSLPLYLYIYIYEVKVKLGQNVPCA